MAGDRSARLRCTVPLFLLVLGLFLTSCAGSSAQPMPSEVNVAVSNRYAPMPPGETPTYPMRRLEPVNPQVLRDFAERLRRETGLTVRTPAA